MEIYYCEKCDGNPYTKKLSHGVRCPICNNILKTEDVDENNLRNRKLLFDNERKILFNKNNSNIFREHFDEKKEQVSGYYQIDSSEEFFLYLNFKKETHHLISCRFIIGNTPDINGVINKTPFISPIIKFDERIEIEKLERLRYSVEKYVLSDGWVKDSEAFYAFLKKNNDVSYKKITTFIEKNDFDSDSFKEEYSKSSNYYIEYKSPSYGDIPINPFKKNHTRLVDEILKVSKFQNNEFINCMFFRAKNGELISELNIAAGAFSILYDDPYANLIRYDRLMKEWCQM